MSELTGARAANDDQYAPLYVVLEVARRRSDDLIGISEIVTDNVILNIARRRRGGLGSFSPDSWDIDGVPVSEVLLMARPESARASVTFGEDVLTTLVHELAHVYAHYTGLKGTSNTGKWHNRRFARIALALGLAVKRPADYCGHTTPGLSARGAAEYADSVALLDEALAMRPRGSRPAAKSAPSPVAPIESPAATKYVFVPCRCLSASGSQRTLRVARGSWHEDSILCLICATPFTVTESLTASGQESGPRP